MIVVGSSLDELRNCLTAIFVIVTQINKYAFSGGQATVEEHREKVQFES
jgi:hypothetical protein